MSGIAATAPGTPLYEAMTPGTPAYDALPLAAKARSILRALHASSQHLDAAALVSGDGVLVASVLGPHVNGDRFAAMCASMLPLGAHTAREVGRGVLRQIILDCTDGPVVMTRAGDAGVLTVAAVAGVNLGALILSARNTARTLSDLAKADAAAG